jgi:hypothetical protein
MPYPKRDACGQGHPYTLENTGYRKSDGVRLCLTCRRVHTAAWYRRKVTA